MYFIIESIYSVLLCGLNSIKIFEILMLFSKNVLKSIKVTDQIIVFVVNFKVWKN